MKEIRYSYFADLTQFNPYQKLLGNELEKMGAHVCPGLIDPKKVNPLETTVLHLHWEDRIYRGKESEEDALKAVSDFSHYLNVLKNKGVFIFWTAHNEEPHENRFPRAYEALRNQIVELADQIFLHSDYLLNANWLRSAKSKIKLYSHGSYSNFYPSGISKNEARSFLKLSETDVVALFFGEMRPYKGVDSLLTAFSRPEVQDTNLKLVLAGSGNLTPMIETYYTGRKDLLRVFNARVPDEKLQIFFEGCDFVVLPFKKILNSGSLILSLSFGREAVIPKAPSLEKFVSNPGCRFYKQDEEFGLTRALVAAAQEVRFRSLGGSQLGLQSEIIQSLSSWVEPSRAVMGSIKDLDAASLRQTTEIRVGAAKEEKVTSCETSSLSEEPGPYLSIIVFGYRSSDVLHWLRRNNILRANPAFQLILAFSLKDIELSNLSPVVLIQGNEAPHIRALECMSHVQGEYVTFVASDDAILELPKEQELINTDFDFLASRTFFRNCQGYFSKSVTNDLFNSGVKNKLEIYWGFPFPGDNSIFYGIFKRRVFVDLLRRFNGLTFHAMDWVWVHLLLRFYNVKKSDNYILLREKSPSHSYTSKISEVYQLPSNASGREVVLASPLARAFKYLLLHDDLLGGGGDGSLEIFRSWYSWFSLKQDELLAALGASNTARKRIVSVNYEEFIGTLREANFEDTKHYE